MKKRLAVGLNFIRLLAGLRNTSVAWHARQVAGARSSFCRSGGRVILRDTGLTVEGPSALLLARAGNMMRQLASRQGTTWKNLPDQKFEAQVQGLKFEVAAGEDVFTLIEVFGRGVYSITTPVPCIVIDVGANIGITPIFFASKSWVKHVFAFEPLKPTAALARANLALNVGWSQKVTLFDYGLSGQDETLSVEYSPDHKTSAGRPSLPQSLPGTAPRRSETIQLRDASKAITPILDSNPELAVVFKMDCEGAEWEILPNLAKSGALARIDQMIIEWHGRTPERLEELLLHAGFSVVRRVDLENQDPIGLMYASKAGRLNGKPHDHGHHS